ncbi:uncharacterized protein LOC115818325 [Chanos chanos]|uniref:Uncharacterized protein LOC115818325 n=1 Tax=Chanos chanos TaxID=29144 RepID=A0A6J2W041_CHACN|nr:uncharacterized protein LOC115818325 [Chanos chanos]
MYEQKVPGEDGTELVQLTPALAAQCGYSMQTDPRGYPKLLASLQSCFTHNMNDEQFLATVQFTVHGLPASPQTAFTASKSCSHTWVSREVVCAANFMEVSVRNLLPDHSIQTQDKMEAFDTQLTLWKIIVFTPEEKSFQPKELQAMGYGVQTSSTRLVMRSPYNMAETYSQDVAGIPMEVFKTVTLYRDRWMMTAVDVAAACPTGGVDFSGDMIIWRFPRQVSPLVSSEDFEILELYLEIDGVRLDTSELATTKYSVSITDLHIIVEILVGAPGGYYKSHVLQDQYHICYTIEPWLELLWMEGTDQTRYKVFFPMKTPLMITAPYVVDNTVAEQRVFDVMLGNFLPDVELLNIRFDTEVLAAAEANARGFNIHENRLQNGSKIFILQVPFSDPVVKKSSTSPEVTVYTLSVIFGLLILPEKQAFSHPAVVQAALKDVVLPTVSGTCDQRNYYIALKYGSKGPNFETIVGKRILTPELAEQYSYHENGTHFTLIIPAMSPDVVFEHFPPDCFPNGTVTAWVPRLSSAPILNPEALTLRDDSCKPSYTDDHFVYFVFSVSSCGTSRKFYDNIMVYENEVNWESGINKQTQTPEEHWYRLAISCHYAVSTTQTLAFHTGPHVTEPHADAGKGELLARMRLSQDGTFSQFYSDEDYPVLRFRSQPLFFEVELMQSADPRVAIVLKDCWATGNDDRTSKPRWNLIADGCENLKDPDHAVIHPVVADARVQLPTHHKRFEIKTFSFDVKEGSLNDPIFAHCDVAICDSESPDALCSSQCVDHQQMGSSDHKRVRRKMDSSELVSEQHVSSGPIILMGS